jgi:protein-tyrosine phosphatase
VLADRHLDWTGCCNVGVAPRDIAADYELSAERLLPLYERLGFGDVNGRIDAVLAGEKTTARTAVLDALASLDVEASLRAGGLGGDELAALRARLLDEPLL